MAQIASPPCCGSGPEGWRDRTRAFAEIDTNDSGNSGFPDAVVDSYDSKFFIANDLQGRRVATFRGTDTYAKETFIWHLPGASGPHWQGGPTERRNEPELG